MKNIEITNPIVIKYKISARNLYKENSFLNFNYGKNYFRKIWLQNYRKRF